MIIFKIVQSDQFAVKWVLNWRYFLKMFFSIWIQVFFAEIKKIQIWKICQNRQKTVFFRKKNAFIFLKDIFKWVRRQKICRLWLVVLLTFSTRKQTSLYWQRVFRHWCIGKFWKIKNTVRELFSFAFLKQTKRTTSTNVECAEFSQYCFSGTDLGNSEILAR